MTTAGADAANADVEMKRVEAMKLRAGGATYREIAEALGKKYGTGSLAYAYQLVHDGIAQERLEAQEDIDEARAIEVRRLDALHLRLTNKLIAQGELPDEATTNAILRVSERRAKLLGLDAPQEVGGPGGGPIPIAVSDTTADAGSALLSRVEKLAAQLAQGMTPEQVAAGLKAPPEPTPPTGVAL